jgi:hypothetical protein
LFNDAVVLVEDIVGKPVLDHDSSGQDGSQRPPPGRGSEPGGDDAREASTVERSIAHGAAGRLRLAPGRTTCRDHSRIVDAMRCALDRDGDRVDKEPP